MKARHAATIVCTGAALAALFWIVPILSAGVEAPRGAVGPGPEGRSLELARARLAPGLDRVDAFVAAQRALTEAEPDEAAHWRVLAEAYLERKLQRDARKGMAVGRATYSELPAEHARDIDAGLAAVERARALGDTSSDLHRVEAGLLSAKIVGIGSMLEVRGRIQEALRKAVELDPENPRNLVAIGCEKLFAPGWLGGDPTAARELLLRGAGGLEVDERPLVFAAMAAYLEDDTELAVQLLLRALERNRSNVYASAVVRRLRAGQEDPFGRDVALGEGEGEEKGEE
jgi:cytochrome c-type biogenesis protein CcmH/NrfG